MYTYIYINIAYMHVYLGLHTCNRQTYMGIYGCVCHTGVVFDKVSIVFMLWASSINNNVGFVQFANLY